MRYDRVPSEEFVNALETADLSPLLSAVHPKHGKLDLHFRTGNRAELYAGLTAPLTIRFHRRDSTVTFSANKKYVEPNATKRIFQTPAPLGADLERALEEYLALDLPAGKTDREGAVQSAWSKLHDPWIALDREARIGYRSRQAQPKFFREVERAWGAIPRYAQRKDTRNTKLDMLAVDSDGNLVLVEVKDAGATGSAGVYHAPLQVLTYMHEWAVALPTLREELDALREVRVRLGLAPLSTPSPTGGLRGVIAFGDDRRSKKVKHRFQEVLDVANRALPAGVPAIEVWMLENGTPERIDA